MLTTYFTLWCQNVKVKHANTVYFMSVTQTWLQCQNMTTIQFGLKYESHPQPNTDYLLHASDIVMTLLSNVSHPHQHYILHISYKDITLVSNYESQLHQHYLHHISDIDMTLVWNVEAAHINIDHLLHISVIDMTLVWNVETIHTKHDRCETWKPSILNMTLEWNVETIHTKHDFGVKHGNHPH